VDVILIAKVGDFRAGKDEMPDGGVIARNDNLEIRRLELGTWGTNAYILICRQTGESVLIDAPGGASTIIENLQGSYPRYILLTHSHIDHIGALSELRSSLKVPLAAHAADSAGLTPPPELLLNDRDVVTFGKVEVEVLHTPGHTPGSLCFRTGEYLMSGDTIFPGGPGRTGSPADFKQIIRSITDKVLTLSEDTLIYPGHGDSTVLKTEKDQIAAFSSRPHNPGLCGQVLWLSS
jgi:glyoxylase-like metal-dependent hydrolase (beta-lactamase superfamily II)